MGEGQRIICTYICEFIKNITSRCHLLVYNNICTNIIRVLLFKSVWNTGIHYFSYYFDLYIYNNNNIIGIYIYIYTHTSIIFTIFLYYLYNNTHTCIIHIIYMSYIWSKCIIIQISVKKLALDCYKYIKYISRSKSGMCDTKYNIIICQEFIS